MKKLFRIILIHFMVLQIIFSASPYLPEMNIFESNPLPIATAADLNDPTCEVNSECNYVGSPWGRWGFCNANICQAPVCGNGTVDGGEACDQGSGNSNTNPNACRTNCQLPTCGDTVIDNAAPYNETCEGITPHCVSCNLIPPSCSITYAGTLYEGMIANFRCIGNQVDNYNFTVTNPLLSATNVLQTGGPLVAQNHDPLIKGTYNLTCAVSSTVSSSSCNSSLTVGYCGDSIKNGPESCDDGNTNNTDNCSNACQWNAICGDGITQIYAGEQCDQGSNNGQQGYSCLNDCKLLGYANSASGEWLWQRDVAGGSSGAGGRKRSLSGARAYSGGWGGGGLGNRGYGTRRYFNGFWSLSDEGQWVWDNNFMGELQLQGGWIWTESGVTLALGCGDGKVQNFGPYNEQCESPNQGNCNNICRFTRCGNGVQEMGEQCDDGNSNTNDNCSNACRLTTCGDGVLQSPNGLGQTEMCDDGNTNNTDSCTQACATPTCGDGYKNGSEACDQGVYNNNSLPNTCRTSCVLPSCGDGVKDTKEMCDDGNAVNGDGCTVSCIIECSGDNDCNGNDTCDLNTNLCQSFVCGNGVREGREECDDNNTISGDGCTAGCLEEGYCGDGRDNLSYNDNGSSYSKIAMGSFHSCGLSPSGITYCWGGSSYGALGSTSILGLAPPMAVNQPSGIKFIKIDNSVYVNCGLTAGGKTYCRGRNDFGQLGNGTTTGGSTMIPTAVSQATGVNFVEISNGGYHTCGLTSTGRAYCRGQNINGSVGDGTTIQRTTPVAVSQPVGVNFQKIALGEFHDSCGISLTGRAYCRGRNDYGQLGDNTIVAKSIPTAVLQASGVNFVEIAVGYHDACGLTSTGQAYCRGRNVFGEVGDGTTGARRTPVAVLQPSGVGFVKISLGQIHSCGLTAGGQTYCRGRNTFGQLGDGTTGNRLTPTAVLQPTGITFVEINAGSNHTCGNTAGGQVYCWGTNANRQMGTQDGTINFSIPQLIGQGTPTMTTESCDPGRHCVGGSANGADCTLSSTACVSGGGVCSTETYGGCSNSCNYITSCPGEKTNKVDIVIVIDRSGTMTPHIANYKQSIKNFIDKLVQITDKIGIVSYNHNATNDYLLGNNFSNAKTAVDGIVAGGKTNISEGIQLAREQLANFSNPSNKQYIVLMTDGEPNVSADSYNCLPPYHLPGLFSGYPTNSSLCHYMNALTEATLAKNDGYYIYSISHNLPSPSSQDELMKQIASYPDRHYSTLDQISIESSLGDIFNSTCGGGCGNGILDSDGSDNISGNSDDEECDLGSSELTGNGTVGAICNNICKLYSCGDGIVSGIEQCDDGNVLNTDACTNSCTSTYCGDGVIQSPNFTGTNEQCDNGLNNNGITSIAGVICNNSCQTVCSSSSECPNGACIAGVCSEAICLGIDNSNIPSVGASTTFSANLFGGYTPTSQTINLSFGNNILQSVNGSTLTSVLSFAGNYNISYSANFAGASDPMVCSQSLSASCETNSQCAVGEVCDTSSGPGEGICSPVCLGVTFTPELNNEVGDSVFVSCQVTGTVITGSSFITLKKLGSGIVVTGNGLSMNYNFLNQGYHIANCNVATSFGIVSCEDSLYINASTQYDLALTKTLMLGQTGFLKSGDLVNFQITLYNQGALDASNIQISDYIPSGLILADSGRTLSGLMANMNYTGILLPQTSGFVNLTLKVDGSVTGNITNWAEISSDDGDDIDSIPDAVQANDIFSGDNNISGNGTGGQDEDDHDPVTITVAELIPGVCNIPPHSKIYYQKRTTKTLPSGTTLCSVGIPSPVPALYTGGLLGQYSGSWSWSCSADTAVNCSATHIYCGNGVVETGAIASGANEQCDDGNNINNDGCSNACRVVGFGSYCGNGFVEQPNNAGEYEQCDDGNTIDGDGCDMFCTLEISSDGVCALSTSGQIYYSPSEPNSGTLCDMGYATGFTYNSGTHLWTWTCEGNGTGSNTSCSASESYCGDGIIGTGNGYTGQEQCEPSLQGSACNASCQLVTPVCNGILFSDNPVFPMQAITITASGSVWASGTLLYSGDIITTGNPISYGTSFVTVGSYSFAFTITNPFSGSILATCSADLQVIDVPITGVCNASIANQTYYTGNLPNTNDLCTSGTLTGLSQTSSGWTWSCEGIYSGGNQNNCSLDISYCGDGIIGTGIGYLSQEQCDGQVGCDMTCLWTAPSCTNVSAVWNPITPYAGETTTGSFSTSQSGISFSGDNEFVFNAVGGANNYTVTIVNQGGSSAVCTLGVTGEYCGDAITNGVEQCDGQVGCDMTCLWTAPSCTNVSAVWNPITPYAGETTTGSFSTSQSGISFSGDNEFVFNAVGGANNYTVTIVNQGGSSAVCTLGVTGEYCGDGITNGVEQCDGQVGCDMTCLWTAPSCTNVSAVWNPITPYAGDTTTGSFSTSQSGISFSGANEFVFNAVGGANNNTVTIVNQGGSSAVCTLGVTGEYCGDGITNGVEQCDGQVGCDMTCLWTAPSCTNVSAVWNPIAPYAGDTTTGSFSTSQSGISFSGANEFVFNAVGGANNYTVTIVNQGGSSAVCTLGVTGEYCGDAITNGVEQCDGQVGCDMTCLWTAPSCTNVSAVWNPITPYAGDTTTGSFSTSQSGISFSGDNEFVFNAVGGANNYTVTIVNQGGSSAVCTLGVTGEYCGDGITNGVEQCDGQVGCDMTCLWTAPSCTNVSAVWNPITPYAGDTTTGSFFTSQSGISFSGANEFVFNAVGGANNYTVTIVNQGGSSAVCTLGVTGEYCGDGITNGVEQCDGQVGCDMTCLWTAPSCTNVSAVWNPITPYAGETTTGSFSTSQSGISFSGANEFVFNAVGGANNYTVTIVNQGGSSAVCTLGVTGEYCGDGITNGVEQCDGQVGCDMTCLWTAPSCTNVSAVWNPITPYAGETTTGSFFTSQSGISFSGANEFVFNTVGGANNYTVTIVNQGGSSAVCTLGVTGEYCGDGITNGVEQCDGQVGCDMTCLWTAPSCTNVSAVWNPITPYSGDTTTGSFSTSQSGISFSGANEFVFNTVGGANNYTVTIVNQGGSSAVCTLGVTGEYCGDGITNGVEQCDGQVGCDMVCLWTAPSCTNVSAVWNPITPYAGETTTGSFSTSQSGISFSGANEFVFNAVGGANNYTVTIVNQGGSSAVCTLGVTGEYCGDGITNGVEQCDGQVGCDMTCLWTAPSCTNVSAVWNPITPYAGDTTTGSFSTFQSGISFSGANEFVFNAVGGANNYTVTIVNQGGSSAVCTLGVTGEYCGDAITNGVEQCEPSLQGSACNASCQLVTPVCNGILFSDNPVFPMQAITITASGSVWASGTLLYSGDIITTGNPISYGTSFVTVGSYSFVFTITNPFSGSILATCSADLQVIDAPITGVCNATMNNQMFYTGSLPSTGSLCTVGTLTGLTQTSSGWTWSCEGMNGGTNDTACSLDISYCGDGIIGTGVGYANEEQYDDGNTIDGDGVSATCQFEVPVCSAVSFAPTSGVPGLEVFATLPVTAGFVYTDLDRSEVLVNVPVNGTSHIFNTVGSFPISVTMSNALSGSFSILCTGVVTVSNAPVNGQCNASMNNQTFYTGSLPSTGSLCTVGTLTGLSQTSSGWTWSCEGMNGGTNDTACSLDISYCGDGIIGTGVGYANEEQYDDGNTIDGDGVSATCQFEVPVCSAVSFAPTSGVPGLEVFATLPVTAGFVYTDLDRSEVLVNIPVNGTSHVFNTVGSFPISVTMSNALSGSFSILCTGVVTVSNAPVNGQCNATMNNQTFYTGSLPSTGSLCTVGTLTGLTQTSSGWTWSCEGMNGGTNDTACSLDISYCGDGIIGTGVGYANEEQYDDGNTIDGDGVSATCQFEVPVCSAVSFAPTSGVPGLEVFATLPVTAGFVYTDLDRSEVLVNIPVNGTSHIFNTVGSFPISVTMSNALSGSFSILCTGVVTVSNAPVNGQCNASMNNQTFYTGSLPSTGSLCTVGTLTGLSQTSSGWTWSCEGINGGTNDTACSLDISYCGDGIIGTGVGYANEEQYDDGNTIDGDGVSATCQFEVPVCSAVSFAPTSGVPGLEVFATLPVTAGFVYTDLDRSEVLVNIPVNGTSHIFNTVGSFPISVTMSNALSGSFSILCTGVVTVSNAPVNGQCNASMNNQTFYTGSLPSTGSLCTVGTLTGLTQTSSGWTWSCEGMNGGTNDTACSLDISYCGDGIIGTGVGYANEEQYDDGNTIDGDGVSATCQFEVPVCSAVSFAPTSGVPGLEVFATLPVTAGFVYTDLDRSEVLVNVPVNGTSHIFNTVGSFPISVTMSNALSGSFSILCTGVVTVSNAPVNGQCNASMNNQTFYTGSLPSTGSLCTVGTLTGLTQTSSGWTWSCEGMNGGTNDTACSLDISYCGDGIIGTGVGYANEEQYDDGNTIDGDGVSATCQFEVPVCSAVSFAPTSGVPGLEVFATLPVTAGFVYTDLDRSEVLVNVPVNGTSHIFNTVGSFPISVTMSNALSGSFSILCTGVVIVSNAPVNGQCNATMNNQTFYTGSLPSTGSLCTVGTLTGLTQTSSGWTWSCEGMNGGTNDTACSLDISYCGDGIIGTGVGYANEEQYDDGNTIDGDGVSATCQFEVPVCSAVSFAPTSGVPGLEVFATLPVTAGFVYTDLDRSEVLLNVPVNGTSHIFNTVGSFPISVTMSNALSGSFSILCTGVVTVSNAPVNGQCNASMNNQTFYTGSLPSTGSLCTVGTLTGLTQTSSGWTWSCEGINGGTNDTACSLDISYCGDGIIGTGVGYANEEQYDDGNTIDGDGVSATCQFEVPVCSAVSFAPTSGVPGLEVFATLPVTAGFVYTDLDRSEVLVNVPVNGTSHIFNTVGSFPISVTMSNALSGSFSILCTGVVTVSNVPVNGQCNATMNNQTFYTGSLPSTGSLCTVGTLTGLTQTSSGWTWSCEGMNGGTNDTACSLDISYCGDGIIGTGVGYANEEQYDDGNTIDGDGVSATCQFEVPVCSAVSFAPTSGVPGLEVFATLPVTAGFVYTDLDRSEVLVNVPVNGTSHIFNTVGSFPISVTMSNALSGSFSILCTGVVTVSNAPVNGQCNASMNNQTFYTGSLPSTGSLCTVGTLTGLTQTSSGWTWSCEGINGGTNDTACSLDISYCGDGIIGTGVGYVSDTEMCDDGNAQNGDGCSNMCIFEVPALGGGSIYSPVPLPPKVINSLSENLNVISNIVMKPIKKLFNTIRDELIESVDNFVIPGTLPETGAGE